MYIVKTIPLTHRERRQLMKAFILGTIFGLVLATVGFSGIAKMLDKGVDTVKTQSTELAK
jgi:hypothetical protein